MSYSNDQLSNRTGKIDPTNGKKGMVVSLDLDEYQKFAVIAGCPRIEGDDGPGELVQPFDDGKETIYTILLVLAQGELIFVAGTSWNVRWMNSGKLGNYYTGAFKLYHLFIGANGTDKSALDLVCLCIHAQ
jgi:hypothetical protein